MRLGPRECVLREEIKLFGVDIISPSMKWKVRNIIIKTRVSGWSRLVMTVGIISTSSKSEFCTVIVSNIDSRLKIGVGNQVLLKDTCTYVLSNIKSRIETNACIVWDSLPFWKSIIKINNEICNGNYITLFIVFYKLSNFNTSRTGKS